MISIIETPLDAMSEIETARTISGKLFRLLDGSSKLINKQALVHVPRDPLNWTADSVGIVWEDIDTDVELRGGAWTVKNAWYEVEIDRSAPHFFYRSKRGGDIEVRLQALDDVPFVSTMSFEERDGVLTAEDIVPGLDLFFTIRPGALQFNKLFKNSKAPRKLTWAITDSDSNNMQLQTLTRGFDNYGSQDASRANALSRNQNRPLELIHTVSDKIAANNKSTYTVTEQWTGNTFVLDAERRRVLSSDAVYPVFLDQDVVETIAVSNDDGYDWISMATWYPDYTYFGNDYAIGMRFQTVNVANAQDIQLAELILNVITANPAASTALTVGYDVDSSVPWSNTIRPSLLAASTTSVSGGRVSVATLGLTRIDVTAIVQEIVDRPGWAANNNMSIMTPPPPLPVFTYGRIEDSYTGGSNPGQLEITFGSGVPAPTHDYQRGGNATIGGRTTFTG